MQDADEKPKELTTTSSEKSNETKSEEDTATPAVAKVESDLSIKADTPEESSVSIIF